LKGETALNYQSTRNRRVNVSAAQAIAQGICTDGGLFVPDSFPAVSQAQISKMEKLGYRERAARIMAPYLTDFSADEITGCVTAAYAEDKFSGGNPAPVVSLKNGVSFLELWHGPTCAFKDMALQILPRFLPLSLQKIHAGKDALILVATSGDTGKAALEGFRGVTGTRILVFYPQNGVSALQERQMRTQEGANVSVVAVRGNFDDAQTGVKSIFGDEHIRRQVADAGLMFSSANSINWGRLLPQIVYYFSAWCDLVASGKIKPGEKVNFCVPTGNFGDILAAYYARKMGLPVHRLICASNANDVLTEFLTTGVYDRNRTFYPTISPSMDILVSSNLERLLFDMTGGDDRKVSGWMAQLRASGTYRVGGEVLRRIRELFYAGSCGDAATKAEIRRLYDSEHYLCDPHTAVAAHVCRKYREETGDTTHTVVVSTASPYKFAPDVLGALTPGEEPEGDPFESVRRLSAVTGAPVPSPIAALEAKPIRFSEVCGKDQMKGAVLEAAGRKV
jgi:threonine synthase